MSPQQWRTLMKFFLLVEMTSLSKERDLMPLYVVSMMEEFVRELPSGAPRPYLDLQAELVDFIARVKAVPDLGEVPHAELADEAQAFRVRLSTELHPTLDDVVAKYKAALN